MSPPLAKSENSTPVADPHQCLVHLLNHLLPNLTRQLWRHQAAENRRLPVPVTYSTGGESAAQIRARASAARARGSQHLGPPHGGLLTLTWSHQPSFWLLPFSFLLWLFCQNEVFDKIQEMFESAIGVTLLECKWTSLCQNCENGGGGGKRERGREERALHFYHCRFSLVMPEHVWFVGGAFFQSEHTSRVS